MANARDRKRRPGETLAQFQARIRKDKNQTISPQAGRRVTAKDASKISLAKPTSPYERKHGKKQTSAAKPTTKKDSAYTKVTPSKHAGEGTHGKPRPSDKKPTAPKPTASKPPSKPAVRGTAAQKAAKAKHLAADIKSGKVAPGADPSKTAKENPMITKWKKESAGKAAKLKKLRDEAYNKSVKGNPKIKQREPAKASVKNNTLDNKTTEFKPKSKLAPVGVQKQADTKKNIGGKNLDNKKPGSQFKTNTSMKILTPEEQRKKRNKIFNK